TKVRGSKTIRYRRSLNHKLCRLGIGRDSILTRSAPYEKSKSLGSGGSMVARLKLKGIDGREVVVMTKPNI
ncbi:rRNA intron-encoded homing endonuclease, partial [Ascobolus immersus RN42]